jgi:hypothetical protein
MALQRLYKKSELFAGAADRPVEREALLLGDISQKHMPKT